MNTTALTVKNTMAALIIATAYASSASAHDFGDILAAGTAPNYKGGQIDVWEVTCPAESPAPDHLAIALTNLKPVAGPIVSFTAYKEGSPFVVKGEADPIDNDGVYSDEVIVKGGSGSYIIMVQKTEGKITPAITAAQAAYPAANTATTAANQQLANANAALAVAQDNVAKATTSVQKAAAASALTSATAAQKSAAAAALAAKKNSDKLALTASSAVAAQSYSLSAHCETITNDHANVDTQEEVQKQNQ